MVIDEAFRFYQHGKFEEALDLIDDKIDSLERGSDPYISYTKLKSRLYYHLGRGDQALYFIEEVLKFSTDLESKTAKGIYLFGQGQVLEAESIMNSITVEELETTEPEGELNLSHFAGLSNYHYLKGCLEEYHGDLNGALEQFEEALESARSFDNRYETNIILYKIATISRQKGELGKAKQFLLQSLELSKELDLTKEIATANTLLGQDYLMETEYDIAIPYLEDGVKYWEDQGSPFGIIWALGELAIVDFLRGNTETALKHYEKIIAKAEEIVPPLYFSGHLLTGIRFALAAEKTEVAENLLEKLKVLASSEDIRAIQDRFDIANSLIMRRSTRISNQFERSSILKKLSNTSKEAIIAQEALLDGINLLLLEYKITENSLLKKEILDEADERLEGLLDQIRLRMGISFEVHSAIIRDKIEALQVGTSNLTHLKELIDQQNNELNWETIIKMIDEEILKEYTTGKETLQIQPEFSFNKEFQSIPSLKIMLYLLPRNRVTFSNLETGTDLSAGHLSGKCTKLEELGYILKEKMFIDEKPATMFSLTSLGYIELKNYMKDLSLYLESTFKFDWSE